MHDTLRTLIPIVASTLHEMWRVNHLQDDGTYTPREKKTEDADWIAAHGTDTVDIANTLYDDLPSDWQAENQAAAEVALQLIIENGGRPIETRNLDEYEKAVEAVHAKWLERNTHADDTPLDIPAKYLTHDERAKDIAQVHAANQIVKELLKDGSRIYTDEYVANKRKALEPIDESA